ncbi:MAG: DUF4349 domain-containing protein [Lysobacter sp.]|nr:DUF4349 domain-containing protein [Lysobacter sp.]
MRSRIAVCLASAVLVAALAACGRQESAAESAAAFKGVAEEVAAADAAAPASAPPMAPGGMADRKQMREAAPQADGTIVDRALVGSVQVDRAQVDPAQLTSIATSQVDPTRRFIRTARASFRVKEVYAAAMAIEDAVAGQGGFVLRNDIQAQTLRAVSHPVGDGKRLQLTEYTMRASLVVRVPSDRTQAFLREIAPQMAFLDQRSMEAVDAQFQILRQQLAWQREQQTQQALGDAVSAGDRLDRKAEVIAAQGSAKLQRDEALIQRREFEDRVAFSTIELSLYQSPRVERNESVDTDAMFDSHRPSFFVRLGEALRTGWYAVLDVFVALMHAWPLWLLAGLGLWGLLAWTRSRRRAAPPRRENGD